MIEPLRGVSCVELVAKVNLHFPFSFSFFTSQPRFSFLVLFSTSLYLLLYVDNYIVFLCRNTMAVLRLFCILVILSALACAQSPPKISSYVSGFSFLLSLCFCFLFLFLKIFTTCNFHPLYAFFLFLLSSFSLFILICRGPHQRAPTHALFRFRQHASKTRIRF